MAHAPREGEDALFSGWNSGGGCLKEMHAIKHDHMSGKNHHCDIDSELIRMGGRKNRSSRASPGNIDGMVDQRREDNRRITANNPSFPPPRDWWRQATRYWGSAPSSADPLKTSTDWEEARRDLGRNLPFFSASGTHRSTEIAKDRISDGEGRRELPHFYLIGETLPRSH